jgi:hypothetical protein
VEVRSLESAEVKSKEAVEVKSKEAVEVKSMEAVEVKSMEAVEVFEEYFGYINAKEFTPCVRKVFRLSYKPRDVIGSSVPGNIMSYQQLLTRDVDRQDYKFDDTIWCINDLCSDR